jgi:hypothetical protein
VTSTSPHADPFATDPDLLSQLRDIVHDIDHAQGPARVLQLNRLEWFVREQIAQGIVRGLERHDQK